MTDRIYGGFWRRLVAYAIDKLILYFVSLFLLMIALFALGLSGNSLHRVMATGELPRGTGLIFLVYVAALLITDMLYFTWFHGSVGQTPGKMALGLRVVQASGEQMTFGLAFLRWVGTIVSSLFLFLGYLWIAIDWEKQGWHDKIAATLVVRTKRDPASVSLPSSSLLPEAALSAQPQAGGPPPPPYLPQGPASAEPPAAPLPSSDAEAPPP